MQPSFFCQSHCNDFFPETRQIGEVELQDKIFLNASANLVIVSMSRQIVQATKHHRHEIAR
ncbi:hypothetical protein D6B98_37025 [Bradyrhizobium sp. LVM 105]|nr:hypothetical protein D6B98_37025 [Bradyrhizobium sp. LVM 105]